MPETAFEMQRNALDFKYQKSSKASTASTRASFRVLILLLPDEILSFLTQSNASRPFHFVEHKLGWKRLHRGRQRKMREKTPYIRSLTERSVMKELIQTNEELCGFVGNLMTPLMEADSLKHF